MDPLQNGFPMTPIIVNGDEGVGANEEHPLASTSFDHTQPALKPVMPVAPMTQPNPHATVYSATPYSQPRYGRFLLFLLPRFVW